MLIKTVCFGVSNFSHLLPLEHQELFDTICMPRTGGILCALKQNSPKCIGFSLLDFNFPWLHCFFLQLNKPVYLIPASEFRLNFAWQPLWHRGIVKVTFELKNIGNYTLCGPHTFLFLYNIEKCIFKSMYFIKEDGRIY